MTTQQQNMWNKRPARRLNAKKIMKITDKLYGRALPYMKPRDGNPSESLKLNLNLT